MGDRVVTYWYELRGKDAFINYKIGPEPGSTFAAPYREGEVMVGKDGIQVRIVDITANAWPRIRAEDQSNDPPREGYRFLMIRIEIANPPNASDAIHVDGSNFDLIVHNGFTYQHHSGRYYNQDSCGVTPDSLDREILPGGRVEGNVCFEVQEYLGGWSLLLSYYSGAPRYLRLPAPGQICSRTGCHSAPYAYTYAASNTIPYTYAHTGVHFG